MTGDQTDVTLLASLAHEEAPWDVVCRLTLTLTLALTLALPLALPLALTQMNEIASYPATERAALQQRAAAVAEIEAAEARGIAL